MVEKFSAPLNLLPIGAVLGLLGMASTGVFFASSLQGQINELRAEVGGEITTLETKIGNLQSQITHLHTKAVSQRDVLIKIQEGLARVDARTALVEQLIREMRKSE